MIHYQIAASLLAADFAKLGEESEAVLTAGADCLHFDAMDNHFVPNLTVGPVVCASLRRYGIRAKINVHLMASPIDNLIIDFAKAGATSITFHAEATNDILQTIDLIHQQGCKAGIAIKPKTSVEDILPKIINKIDSILIMTVEPGFGGQKFIPAMLDKITRTRNLISDANREIPLAVDGGIKVDNIALAADAGANVFVVGTEIFDASDYKKVITELRNKLL